MSAILSRPQCVKKAKRKELANDMEAMEVRYRYVLSSN